VDDDDYEKCEEEEHPRGGDPAPAKRGAARAGSTSSRAMQRCTRHYRRWAQGDDGTDAYQVGAL
jgi:hypothetical protein